MNSLRIKFQFVKKGEINNLPKKTGVYCFRNKTFLYIGKARNIQKRVKNHFQTSTFRENIFLEKTKKIGFIETKSEIEALILEANLIKEYQPKYNILWRDNKNYFYVGFTKEDYPRIFITHQPKLQTTSYKLQAKFVGPFVDGKALKKTLKILRKIFPYRTCKKIFKKACLWYQLNRCLAPCLLKSKSTKEIPAFTKNFKKECQKNADAVFKILKGKQNQILKELKTDMKKAAKSQEFEKAAKIRDKVFALERILAHTKIFEISEKEIKYSKVERKLRELLKIKKKINRIEAYDISAILGKEAAGSMVTFIKGKPNKNFYRKFKIKLTGRPNDVLMLKETLSRRFKHKEWDLPDLILIDGGKPQLSVAINSKSQVPNLKNIKVIALAKKKNELFIENRKKPISLKKLPREIFNLILQLRDEAHRFAISYHKKLRKKKLLG